MQVTVYNNNITPYIKKICNNIILKTVILGEIVINTDSANIIYQIQSNIKVDDESIDIKDGIFMKEGDCCICFINN